MSIFTETFEAEVEAAGSVQALADKLGFSPQYLYDVRRGKPPSPKLLQKLGLEKVVEYRRVK